MLNNVALVGRLTKDVDLRYTPNGVAVATATLAVNRNFKNQQGETEADFIRIVVWRKPAENLANYMGKGSLIGVTGSIQTRTYDDESGKRVYITEVVANNVAYLESSNKKGQAARQNQPSNQGPSPYDYEDRGGSIEIGDDELPF